MTVDLCSNNQMRPEFDVRPQDCALSPSLVKPWECALLVRVSIVTLSIDIVRLAVA